LAGVIRSGQSVIRYGAVAAGVLEGKIAEMTCESVCRGWIAVKLVRIGRDNTCGKMMRTVTTVKREERRKENR